MKASGVVKSEPALVTMAALWLLTNVGAAVVERWHWLGADQWSTLSQSLTPLVTAGIAALAGWLLRRVVTPAWRALEQDVPMLSSLVEEVTGIDVDKVLAEAQAEFPMPTEPEPDKAA